MTKTTPEQMLELAKIIEPDKYWSLEKGKVIAREYYEGLPPSVSTMRFDFSPENNPAQLMQVAFVLWDSCDGLVLAQEGKSYIIGVNHKKSEHQFTAATKEQAILNLAIEVLL